MEYIHVIGLRSTQSTTYSIHVMHVQNQSDVLINILYMYMYMYVHVHVCI